MLLLALAGLYYAYRVMVMPPTLQGESGNKEGYRHRFSLYGFGAERLTKPSDVAIGADGRIYVADTQNHRVVVYDSAGRYVKHFGERGTGALQIESPSGIAVAPDGTVFVLSKKLNKVVIYDSGYRPRREIEVSNPQVATVSGGKLYLVTYRGIMIGDLRGNQITAFGRRGRELGQVDHPGGIAVGADGKVFVADTLNYRVQAFDADGDLLWHAGEPPAQGEAIRNRGRRFGLPVGLAVGDDGLLYLVDAFNGLILVLDPLDGEELARYGEWGHDEGMLYYPAGIAHGEGSRFAVADKYNDRVQVLDIDSPADSPLDRALNSPLAWLLLLALLPLLLLLVPKLYVSERRFLDAIIQAEAVPNLIESVKRLDTTEAIKNDLADVTQDGVELGPTLREIRVSDRRITKMAKKHDLDTENAELLVRSKRLLGYRAVLMTDDLGLRDAATKERVKWISSTELLSFWEFEVEDAVPDTEVVDEQDPGEATPS
jgi:DNA-binding beta-propeller fold protein YncE